MKRIFFSLKSMLFILLPGFAFAFFSCNKDDENDSRDLSQVRACNYACLTSNELMRQIIYTLVSAEDSILHPNDTANLRFPMNERSIIISDTNNFSFPKTYTLQFPTGGILCFDGIFRKGSLQIVADTFSNVPFANLSVSFQSFRSGSINASGNFSLQLTQIDNMPTGYYQSGSYNFSIDTLSTSITSQLQYQWALGHSTKKNLADDLFLCSGKIYGSDFSATITNSLQFVNFCPWIAKGSVEIKPDNFSIRNLTYLDSCAASGKVIINNQEQVIYW